MNAARTRIDIMPTLASPSTVPLTVPRPCVPVESYNRILGWVDDGQSWGKLHNPSCWRVEGEKVQHLIRNHREERWRFAWHLHDQLLARNPNTTAAAPWPPFKRRPPVCLHPQIGRESNALPVASAPVAAQERGQYPPEAAKAVMPRVAQTRLPSLFEDNIDGRRSVPTFHDIHSGSAIPADKGAPLPGILEGVSVPIAGDPASASTSSPVPDENARQMGNIRNALLRRHGQRPRGPRAQAASSRSRLGAKIDEPI